MSSDSDEDESLSGDDNLDEDMEGIRRACLLSGIDPKSLGQSHAATSSSSSDEDEEDEFELLRGIRQRCNAACNEPPLTLKPLSVLMPPIHDDDIDDDDDDDFAVLRSIQKRFSRYDQDHDLSNNNREKQEQVPSKNTYSKKETSNNVDLDKAYSPKAVPDSVDMCNTPDNIDMADTAIRDDFSSCFSEGCEFDTHDSAMVPTEGCGFPKAAQNFVEAIRKNRACQKFIRNKMMQIEARIEENKKLQHRVKTLRGFQIKCKKETTRALSQKQDARYQLISAVKLKGKSKADGKDPAICHGPAENSQVASYKMVLAEYRLSLSRRKWTDEERKNLTKGIKQQFQELLLQRSVDSISEMEGDTNDIDDIYASIKERDITSENLRLFLPKVNWERLASMYLKGRSGAECEARWLNWEDPLINHKPWTSLEDKKLLHIVQQRGISNWMEIAALLETNRTPFQCLARYQRSLNASVLRSEWSKDEDEKLCAAVAAFGESNWENVAATLVGRTGPQCSNRWIKSLNPAREKTGRWSLDEDKRVKVAVIFFGPKNWKKVAQFVPGRTHVQCRERWANNLDPSLNMGEWTEEEDTRLKEAIVEHGYCWTRVAASVASRTDNQCTRRWKALFPHDVPRLQAARKIQKAALISNFVDRESERPALGPNDFIPLALTNAVSESGELNKSGKQRRKPRSKKATKNAVSGEKTNSKKKPTRPRKNREASEATEAARVGQEIMPLDGKIKKKMANKKQKMALRSKIARKEAQSDETILKKGVDLGKVSGEKTKLKKPTLRSKKNNAGIGQEVVPLDGETKKKKTTTKRKMTPRDKSAIEEAHICTNYGVDAKEVAGENINSKEKPTRQHKRTEASEATRKKTMPSREWLKEKVRVATSRGDRLAEVKRATKPQLNKTTGPTLSRVSACGESEVITMTTVEEVAVEEVAEHNGDRAGANNKISSKSQCKRFSEAASSFGENESFSEVRKFSSPHLEQDWHADPSEVNSSPCPNLVSSRINNVHEAKAVADVGKRKKRYVISRSSRIKCRALLREASDVTEISDSETLGSIILKKREMMRSLKMLSGLNRSSRKTGSIVNKEVGVTDEIELVSEISRDAEKIKNSGRYHSRSRGERKDRKSQARKRENAKLGKYSIVDNGTHRGEKRKRSRTNKQLGNGHEFGGEEGDDTTLVSFLKEKKKRRLNYSPKTPPIGEFSKSPASIGLVDGHIHDEAGDSDNCCPPPGFEKPIYKTGHLAHV